MYTTDAKSACTKFELKIANSTTASPGTVDLGRGRQILCVKDPAVKKKITTVAMLRRNFTALVDIPSSYGTFDGMTDDLAVAVFEQSLRIVWKSVLGI